jgi:hypothetical protein
LRKLILAGALLAAAAPAAAQPPRHSAPLPPPGAIGAIGDRVADTADALMDVDVGPVVDAIDPQGRRGPRRLGDIATHGDPYARQRMHRDIDVATARMNAMARQLAIMAPQLMAAFHQAKQQFRAAMRAPVEPRGHYGAPPAPDEGYGDEPPVATMPADQPAAEQPNDGFYHGPR